MDIMEVIYVNHPSQSKDTKNPQIIKDKLVEWNVRSEMLKSGETFKEFLKRKYDYYNRKLPNSINGMFIYDIIPLQGIIGMTGMVIRYQIFNNKIWI
jgi:hypothetical protein